MEEVRAAAAAVERSNLFHYLCSHFPIDEVRRVCKAYQVGATAEFGATPGFASAFPFINSGGECVDVHLQPYEVNGHRWKQDKHPYFQNWLLSKRKQSDRRAPWCLFGEHLLSIRPTAPVGVVESEKTALICSLAAPGYVWVATASLANLNARRCAAIRGRECYVFPDNDGIDKWEDKATDLANDGFNIHFAADYINQNAEGAKDDLADIILRCRRGEQRPQEPTSSPAIAANLSPDQAQADKLWMEMKQRNPYLAEFESAFKLTPQYVEPITA